MERKPAGTEAWMIWMKRYLDRFDLRSEARAKPEFSEIQELASAIYDRHEIGVNNVQEAIERVKRIITWLGRGGACARCRYGHCIAGDRASWIWCGKMQRDLNDPIQSCTIQLNNEVELTPVLKDSASLLAQFGLRLKRAIYHCDCTKDDDYRLRLSEKHLQSCYALVDEAFGVLETAKDGASVDCKPEPKRPFSSYVSL